MRDMAEQSNGKAPQTARRVEAEHRRLESLFRRTRRALARPCAPAEAEDIFGRLRGEVNGHLAQEDTLYYPPLGALRPEYKDALEQLVGAHDVFRRQLAEIAEHLARGAGAACSTNQLGFTRRIPTGARSASPPRGGRPGT